MKDVREWGESYILSLPPGEHDWVEFKGSALLDLSLPSVDENRVLEELSKQLSAFSNTGGGTLVYGVADRGGRRSVDCGGVSLRVKNGTKEWLEDVIPRLVELELRKFNVYVVESAGEASSITPGKGLVLIEIPDSIAAPHQARDQRYYARVGGKSRPIGHRMVLDILGRGKYPALTASFFIVRGDQGLPELRVTCRNAGQVLARYVNGWVTVPREMALAKLDGDDPRYFFANTLEDVVGFMRTDTASHPFSITRYEPVLPGLSFTRKVAHLLSRKREMEEYGEKTITWKIHADNAPVREGSLAIKDVRWDKEIQGR